MTKTELQTLLERAEERTRFVQAATLETLIGETPEQQEERIKTLFRQENYGLMFNHYFGKDTPIPMAENDCAWYHLDIYKQLFNKAYLTLFNLIFRGGAKSTHANLGYPFALKQAGEAKFFLVVGANELRAKMLLQDLQIQFESNNRIIKDFGIQKVYGSWADGQFETPDKCTFMALGIDQPFRGLRQNGVRLEYVSIDDVEDKKRAKNQALTREYIEKVTGDIQGAFSTRSERTIINNNYFVKKGFIEGLAKKKGFDLRKIDTKKRNVIHHEYASLYLVNLTDKYYDTISAENADTWKPEWEDRFSKSDCLRKVKQYENDKETLSGEHYNTPINAGKRIKDNMIKMVEPLPLKDYAMIGENWDLAYGNEACHKAKATAGVDMDNMQIVVTDVFCRQTDISVAIKYHYQKAKEVLKQNQAFISYYDASVAQETVYTPQWLLGAQQYKCFHIPLPQKSTVDKYIKIDTVLIGALTNGILAFSKNLENNPDWDEAKAQMLNFEKGGGYPVDFPDALSDLLIQLKEYTSTFMVPENEASTAIIGKRNRGGY